VNVTAQIVVGVLLGLLAYWVKSKNAATASVVQPHRPALRERLRALVKGAGWGAALIVLAAWMAGCTTPAVYVPAGEPVRIAVTIKRATVEVMLPTGQTSRRTMDIPAGWYALPDPDDGKTN
jgi:hypothetical protein